MIRARKTKSKKPFSVVDIETNRAGELLALCLYDGVRAVRFYTWSEFLEFLYTYNHRKQYQNIFAHYGGGFDYVHFIESALDEMDHVNIITSGSEIIMIKLSDFEHEVTFADSIKTLLAGLKALGDKFEIADKKKDIDIQRIEEIFKDNPVEFWEYLENDVISLYQVMIKFMDLLEIETFPVTAASLAMQIFKERFLPQGVNLFKPSFKPEDDLDKWITESYAGGRVECFRPGIHKGLNAYDLNSLYPYCMEDLEIPDCLPVTVSSYSKEHVGFYEIEFQQLNRNVPPVLWQRSLEIGLEFVYSGKGVFCSIEIDKLLEMGGTIEIIKGIIYPRTAKVFKEYVNHFYGLRQSNKDGAIDHICKILLNALYGKFAQKQESTTLQKLPGANLKALIDKGESVTSYDEEKGLYTVGEVREIKHRMIHVASIITAKARVTLYGYLHRHAQLVVYCDTDSVHLKGIMDQSYLGKELGQMKLEDSGNGVYIGRKMYCINRKLKFKGVKTSDKLAPDYAQILTPADLEKIWQGEILEFSYHTFPKLKSVLKGEKAAKLKKITKKLRPGKHLSNFKPI